MFSQALSRRLLVSVPDKLFVLRSHRIRRHRRHRSVDQRVIPGEDSRPQSQPVPPVRR